MPTQSFSPAQRTAVQLRPHQQTRWEQVAATAARLQVSIGRGLQLQRLETACWAALVTRGVRRKLARFRFSGPARNCGGGKGLQRIG
jgi:hypothetical protein